MSQFEPPGPASRSDACCSPVASAVTPESALRVLLLSTYELGHQPFGLASPAAWLRAAGCAVDTGDLAVETVDEQVVAAADVIAVYLPMHTATRLACELLPRLRSLNPSAHLCAYGLYAPVNEDLLRSLGVATVLGGEFEESLTRLAASLRTPLNGSDPTRVELPLISLSRQEFRTPDRTGLPALSSYARFQLPDGSERLVGYTEATRGCKHLCRHCPVVPVYGGHFRVVQRDVVLADIDWQIANGAEHITFGDPDFFNGPRHAMDVVEQLHARHPAVSYDVTIKIEHLVARPELLPALARTGCALVTSAVEAFDERILTVFDKRHTREDVERAVSLLRGVGIAVNPTFVAFTPWTGRSTYTDYLSTIYDLGLVGSVSPIQYAIRLLVPRGSLLLQVDDTPEWLGEFDQAGLCYRWAHPDPVMDDLQAAVMDEAERAVAENTGRSEFFRTVAGVAADVLGGEHAQRLDRLRTIPDILDLPPHLTEPWYCCAEPVATQLEPLL